MSLEPATLVCLDRPRRVLLPDQSRPNLWHMNRPGRIMMYACVTLVAATMFCVVGRVASRPEMPSQWRKLYPGMSMSESIRLASGPEISTFEFRSTAVPQVSFLQETRILGIPARWVLIATYDSKGLVAAQTHFFVPGSSLLSSSSKPLISPVQRVE